MKVVAHRGANKEALENSWTAFSKAIEGTAERIELDVQRTLDNTLIVMHDSSLLRTTGHDLPVGKTKSDDIKKIKLINGDDIPFLNEVLAQLLPKVEINIEIKDPDDSTARLVSEIIINSGFDIQRLIVSSFNPIPLIYLAEHQPNLPLAALWDGDIKWPYFSYTSPNLFMERIKGTALHPSINRVTSDLVDMAHDRGWQVIPYAAMNEEDQNKEALWSWLKTLGVDGHCTNYPRQLRAWLEEENEYDRKFS